MSIPLTDQVDQDMVAGVGPQVQVWDRIIPAGHVDGQQNGVLEPEAQLAAWQVLCAGARLDPNFSSVKVTLVCSTSWRNTPDLQGVQWG